MKRKGKFHKYSIFLCGPGRKISCILTEKML